MQAIKLAHGTVFVTDGKITVRLSKTGECVVSPITFSVLEWDLKNEPLDSYEYLTEGEIFALENDGYNKILQVFEKTKKILKV